MSVFSRLAVVGGICGVFEGAYGISNCYNTGNVSSSSSFSSDAGGICGFISSSVSNCYNTGNVSSSSSDFSDAGGICGNISSSSISSSVSNCYNTGDVSSSSDFSYAGGICGYGYGSGISVITISNCYNTGAVSSSTYSFSEAGGICGLFEVAYCISNCYNTGDVSSSYSSYSSFYGAAGGICGGGRGISGITISNVYWNSDSIQTIQTRNGYAQNPKKGVGGSGIDNTTPLTTSQMKMQSSFAGFDFDTVWGIDSGINNGYPYLRSLPYENTGGGGNGGGDNGGGTNMPNGFSTVSGDQTFTSVDDQMLNLSVRISNLYIPIYSTPEELEEEILKARVSNVQVFIDYPEGIHFSDLDNATDSVIVYPDNKQAIQIDVGDVNVGDRNQYDRKYKLTLAKDVDSFSFTIRFYIDGKLVDTKTHTVVREILSFKYLGGNVGENKTYTSECYYSNNFFEKSSYDYRHDLATMSLCLAMSAFGAGDLPSYKNYADNVRDLLENELRFENVEVNDDYLIQPTISTMGVIAGIKTIKVNNDEEYELIAIAFRGGGYEREWGGNFYIGTGVTHQGFDVARQRARVFLNAYYEKNKSRLEGKKIKIWLTGYSRGSAVANLVAADLIKESVSKGSSGFDFTTEPKNIYTYCFETPAPTRSTDTFEPIFNNIFCIINPNDFVPRFAPAGETEREKTNWGYHRYGKTVYLPSETTTNYTPLKEDMVAEFAKLSGFNANDYLVDSFFKCKIGNMNGIGIDMGFNIALWGVLPIKSIYPTFSVTAEKFSQSIFLDNFISILANDEFLSYANYNLYYQDNMVRLLESFGADNIDLKELVSDVGVSLIKTSILHPNDALSLVANLDCITQGHMPELCLAWMKSMNDATIEEDFDTGKYRIVRINCPVNVEVYDSNNVMVAQILNDIPQDIAGSSIVAIFDENGQKIIYLPADEEYTIKIISTGDGEMTYSVNEFDRNELRVTRVVNYLHIAIQNGDTFEGKIENLSSGQTAKYELTDKNRHIISMTEDLQNDNISSYMVNVQIKGNGNVVGGGSRIKGEYAQLTAYTNNNEKFLGWYIDNELISTDNDYRVCVLSDITLEARFAYVSGGVINGGGNTGGNSGDNGGSSTGGGTNEPTPISATLDIREASFDKSSPKNIAATLSLGSYAFKDIKNGDYALVSGKDYSVSENTYTIKMEYLATLADGKYTLTFNMSGGTAPTIALTIKSTEKAIDEAKDPYTVSELTEEQAKALETALKNMGLASAGSGVYITVSPETDESETPLYEKIEIDYDGDFDPSQISYCRLNDDGTFTPVATAYDPETNTITIYANKSGIYVPVTNEISFVDVTETDWFYPYVNEAVKLGIVYGRSKEIFDPLTATSYADTVAMLLRAMGISQNAQEEGEDWSKPYIDKAVSLGIYNSGWAAGDVITREKMAMIAANSLKMLGMAEELTAEETNEILDGFIDSDKISTEAREALAICIKAGLIIGMNESIPTIEPQGEFTRAQMATIAVRFRDMFVAILGA
ncbi:MAG: S-layer homology domain-containing protein [Oscillospiraceae bacterium]|nr:S-layer homology domain-containing protein [Oscillospiraceae bacterium]